MEQSQFLEDLSYEEAAARLENILERLKNDEISIDNLENEVADAAILSNFCAEKLRKTETKVNEIIEKLGL